MGEVEVIVEVEFDVQDVQTVEDVPATEAGTGAEGEHDAPLEELGSLFDPYIDESPVPDPGPEYGAYFEESVVPQELGEDWNSLNDLEKDNFPIVDGYTTEDERIVSVAAGNSEYLEHKLDLLMGDEQDGSKWDDCIRALQDVDAIGLPNDFEEAKVEFLDRACLLIPEDSRGGFLDHMQERWSFNDSLDRELVPDWALSVMDQALEEIQDIRGEDATVSDTYLMHSVFNAYVHSA